MATSSMSLFELLVNLLNRLIREQSSDTDPKKIFLKVALMH